MSNRKQSDRAKRRRARLAILIALAIVALLVYRSLPSVLIYAARTGNFPLALLMLNLGVDPNTSGSWGSQERSVVETILGVRPDNHQPVLIMAISFRHPDIARMLLQRGADPNAADGASTTALMEAIWENDAALVRELL